MESWLRDILCCPKCHAPLRDSPQSGSPTELVCTAADCGLAYPVEQGIPVLLVDHATSAPAQP
ncbi:MAG: Trm112 family protein [Angustibacter sp.]